MSSFRKLTLASTIATLCLVAIGGLVRATKSGLGCGTDWPDCGGRVIPVFGSPAVAIEYAHRLAAAAVIVLIGALAFVGLRRMRDRGGWAAAGAFGLVLGQAVLGAIVVKLELDAVSVVLHLGLAMTLLAVLVHLTVKAHVMDGKIEPAADGRTATRARVAAGAVFLLLLVGSYVSGRDAGYVFPDWPLMNGALVPDLSVDLHAIHFIHRALAAIVAVIVAVAVIPVVRGSRDATQVRLAYAAGGLYLLQVLIGAANVWTRLNSAFVTVHLLTGALIWACLVGLAAVAQQGVARSEAGETLATTQPAIEMANR